MKYYDIDLQHLLKITRFGKTILLSPEHHLTRYIHGIIIYIVASGSITLKQNDEIVKLGKGDVYVFEDGEHQTPLACEDCTYYYIHFEQEHLCPAELSDDDFKELVLSRRKSFAGADIYTDLPYLSIHAVIPKRLHVSDSATLERIISPFKHNRLSYDCNTPEHRLELSAITAKLLMELESITQRAVGPSHCGKLGTVYDTASKILQYVEKHYNESFCADDIVSNFYLNYDYANRIFKKHFGRSIIDHRNRLRINTAKSLLLDKSVEETATEVGFSNPYYFSKCFKKYEQISPVEYKERLKNESNENRTLH